MENALQVWWGKIRALHSVTVSYETAFLKVIAEITSKFFDANFGKSLFSAKSVTASICYSNASVILSALAIDLSQHSTGMPWWRMMVICGLGLIFLVLGFRAIKINPGAEQTRWLGIVWITSGIILVSYCMSLTGSDFGIPVWITLGVTLVGTLLVVVFAVSCDFLFITITRLILRRVAGTNSFIIIAAFILGNIFLAIALIYFPLELYLYLDSHASPNDPTNGILSGIAGFVGFSNIIDAFIALAFIGIAVMMLLHRLLWPIAERPLHALYRYRLFSEQKKIVFFAGVALICLAAPQTGERLEKLVKSILG